MLQRLEKSVNGEENVDSVARHYRGQRGDPVEGRGGRPSNDRRTGGSRPTPSDRALCTLLAAPISLK